MRDEQLTNTPPFDVRDLPAYRMLAFGAFLFCILVLIDGLSPQVQMYLFGGQILATNSIVRLAFLTIPILTCFIHPKIEPTELPLKMCLLCVVYLLADTPHLILGRGMTLKEALTSYSDYYLLLLMGPALLAFENAISEKVVIRGISIALIVCAAIGFAQYVTGSPILRLESSDGRFEVFATSFFDEIRAFSLFTSGLSFGLFCSLGAAIGIAFFRTAPLKGAVLLAISTIACYSTLTRLCYLVFLCTCVYALVLTFGKNPGRGLWLPFLFLAMGVVTIFTGSGAVSNDSGNALQNTGSLLMRLEEWTYYTDLLARSEWSNKLFGLGTVLDKKNLIPIDNVPLALALHIGLVGFVLFGTLLIKMWLYLRKQALVTRQPFIIAAASLWATLFCAGIFNIVFVSFGTVFAIAVLCSKSRFDEGLSHIERPANLVETPLLS